MENKDIYDDCKIRFLCMGFDYNNITGFSLFLKQAVRKTENYIKNFCNISSVPLERI